VGYPMKARDYVNMVRLRAKNSPPYSYKDPADPSKGFSATPAANYNIALYADTWVKDNDARDKVRFERKLELSGEGHRFFDLVRWGIAEPELNAYLSYRLRLSLGPALMFPETSICLSLNVKSIFSALMCSSKTLAIDWTAEKFLTILQRPMYIGLCFFYPHEKKSLHRR
jgi:hypothetical protein